MFQTYDQSELLQAKLEILSKTNMIDYVIDIRRMLYPDEDTPEVNLIFIMLAFSFTCPNFRLLVCVSSSLVKSSISSNSSDQINLKLGILI